MASIKKRTLAHKRWRGGKVPREAPPPSKWGVSKTGSTKFIIRKVSWRNERGQKLYRLGYGGYGDKIQYGSKTWTLDELNESGVTWLQESPFPELERASASVEVNDGPVPEGAAVDEEPQLTTEQAIQAGAAKMAIEGATFEARYGFGVGDKFLHPSGNHFEIVEIIDPDTAKVRQVSTDGVKKPARKMRGSKMSKIK